jgi:glycine oxidase
VVRLGRNSREKAALAATPHPGPPPQGGRESAAPAVLIDCRGWSARDALADLRGVRGEMLLVRTGEVRLSRPVRLLHPRIPLYVVPRADGVFMIGATMIESAEKAGMSVRSAIELLNAAFTLHPAFGEAEILEMSADVRPAFADNEPRLVERDGRIFLNGAYRHGYLLAPDLAKRAAERAMDQRQSLKTAS